jgi:hypothetical protein
VNPRAPIRRAEGALKILYEIREPGGYMKKIMNNNVVWAPLGVVPASAFLA